jgi:hypothetical protein
MYFIMKWDDVLTYVYLVGMIIGLLLIYHLLVYVSQKKRGLVKKYSGIQGNELVDDKHDYLT